MFEEDYTGGASALQNQNSPFNFPEKIFTPQKIEGKLPPEPPKTPSADEVVDKIFNAAVVTTVEKDTEIQEKIVVTAKEAIHNKTQALKHQTETEAKEAYFKSNEGACGCFGFEEKDTEKWAVSLMKIWHRVMTAIWICIGFFTYAPITFIAKKLGVIIKKTWIAVVISAVIYFLIATSPIWIKFFSNIGA